MNVQEWWKWQAQAETEVPRQNMSQRHFVHRKSHDHV